MFCVVLQVETRRAPSALLLTQQQQPQLCINLLARAGVYRQPASCPLLAAPFLIFHPAACSMPVVLVAVVCWQINEEICKLSKLDAF